MSRFLSLATGIVCLGLLASTVFVFDLSCLPHHPLAEKNPLLLTWVEIVAQKEQLQRLEEDLHRYWEAKEQVAQEVIARRRSLKEAIDEFRQLDQPRISASHQEQTLKDWGLCEEEWRGRDVIAFVGRVLAGRPDEAATAADQLAKELQELLADRKKHGLLPTAPPSQTVQRPLNQKQGGR